MTEKESARAKAQTRRWSIMETETRGLLFLNEHGDTVEVFTDYPSILKWLNNRDELRTMQKILLDMEYDEDENDDD